MFEAGSPLAKITTLRRRTTARRARSVSGSATARRSSWIWSPWTTPTPSGSVDFAAGLAFALRGSFDKVATKVFLLSPADVDVTAEQRRRIAEAGFYAYQ